MSHSKSEINQIIRERIIADTRYRRFIFFLIASVNILAISIDIFWLKAITKPFITLLLIAIYVGTFGIIIKLYDDMQKKPTLSSQLDESIKSVILNANQSMYSIFNILPALLFCFLGDIFLLFNNTFLVGLVCFLAAHIYFWSILWKNSSKKEGLVVKNKILILPFIAYLGFLIYSIFPHLKNDLILQIAVVIYGMVITISSILALNRFGFVSKKTFVLVFVGFLFFIVSDTWIAWQKFVLKTNHTFDNLMVMATYIIALFLIVQGFIDQKVTEIRLIFNKLNLFSNTKPKQRASIIKESEQDVMNIFNQRVEESKKQLTKKEKEALFEQIKREFINQKNKKK